MTTPSKPDYEGPERRTPEHWHFKKELTAGHLLTTITIIVGLFTWGAQMENRMVTLEVRTDSMQRESDRMGERLERSLQEIKNALDKLVDRELERSYNINGG